MKRTLRKAIAFVLALALSFQFVSITNPATRTYAAELSDFDISEDGTAIYGYYGTDEDLVIPDGYTEVYLYSIDTVKTLTVPEGVTSLSVSSESLEKLALPSTITYLYVSWCPCLKEIDLSKISGKDDGYYGISDVPALTDLKLGKLYGEFDLGYAESLNKLDLSKTDFYAVNIYCNENLKEIKFNESLMHVTLAQLGSLKKADIPKNVYSLYLSNVDFDALTIKDNLNGFFIKDGGLYQEAPIYYTEFGAETAIYLEAVDFNRKTINVAEGTEVINNLNLSGNYYKIETINLPDSVTQIAPYAFEGASNLKSLSIPKNVITLGAYAFSGLSEDIELTIPASTEYISGSAFAGFKGKVKLEKNTRNVTEFEDGIYYHYLDSKGNRQFSELVYYPNDKTDITFMEGTNYIGYGVFMDSAISSLDFPEGLSYIEISLKNAYNLTSVSIPSTVTYIYPGAFYFAPALKSITVSPDNKYFTSYDNCLYNKDMTALIEVPSAMEKIDIPEGVISMNYYTVFSHYIDDPQSEYGYRYLEPEVYFPKSLSEFSSLSFGKAYVYADTPMAEEIQRSNSEYAYWGEVYDYEPYQLNYELRDSNKELLDMIYVVDSVTIQKGKKVTLSAEMPYGLKAVTSLSLGNNTECKVKFSSSDKKIAKVNSKTGQITAKKKGTCTINVKCTIDNGKKKNTKTFKVKVKVK